MNKDTKNIWNAYKLLTEISKRDMDLVRYDRPVEELPFDNIFGDKLRIVLPISLGESSDSFFDSLIFNIEGAITLDKFKAKFPNILKFVRFDYKTKKAIVRIQTQMGEKDREETLASLVDKMYKCDVFPKDYRDKAIKWIEQNVAQLTPSAYVVLSRSVIDNLRMSDISGIESCHSPGGGYYSSCLSEAAGGGVIAFVIDGGELKKKQIENIETDEEIFSDKDRSVEGLEATYRLRMRKYYSSPTGYFVLPETKVYKQSTRSGVGNSVRVPGLVEVLIDFLKSKQELNKEDLIQLFTDKDIVRKGGSYEDTADSYLFNQYFGGSDFRGYINHEEEELDEEESEQAQNERRYEQFQHELADFYRRSGVREAQHVNSSYEVETSDDGDYIYYYAFGSIEIDLDDISLVDEYDGTDDELDDIEEVEQLRNTIIGNNRYRYEKVTERKTKFYRVLFSELDKIGIDKDDVRSFHYTRNGYTVKMYEFLSDYNNDDGMTSSDVDNYPHFLRTLMEWNGKYNQIKTAFVRALSIAGYADLTDNEKITYGLADYDETKRTFTYAPNSVTKSYYTPKNLKYEGNWASFIIQTGINPTYLYNVKDEYGVINKLKNDIRSILTLFIEHRMKNYSDQHGAEWRNDYEQQRLKLENYDFDISFGINFNNSWIHFDMRLQDLTRRTNLDDLNETASGLAYKISFEVEDRNTFAIRAIDESIDDVKNLIKICFYKTLKIPYDPSITRLMYAYREYLKNLDEVKI